MKFGTLQVALLTGETRDFPIDLPSVIVGRGEGATILLDDFSVSRRHARLTVDSGRLMVEDLASAAGTFINGERLAPNIRYLVDDGAELRFGDLDASYSPPPPADAVIASTDEDGAAYSPTGLHVALVSPAVAIDAGRQATATVTVTNRGRVVDTVSVEVTDLPPDWYTIETTQASLLPGTHLEVTVRLHPPRRHDSRAGHYDFTVAVSSQSHQREAIAIGHFEVLPFESFGLAFEAIRSGRNFRLIAENRGNEPVRYALAGQDDEQAFRYQFDAPVVHLQPGQKQVVALKVRRPRQLFGPKIAHPFEVVGTTATGSEVRARGQLSVAPPLQKFRMPALFTLAALILGVTALAILILTDGESIQTAGAEDEYAGVHLCDEEGAQEKQEEKNQDAASEAPNTSAVVAGLYDGGRPIFGQTDANGAPFFAQNDPRWGSVEYARSTELPAGKDWCGTTISQCGCAMTSVAVMLALYNVVNLPDGQPLTPQSLNAWFNGDARRTDRGWVSRGYIYGDVIWTAANELSGEIARANPGTPTVRFVRTGTGSEDEIRAELRAGRPIILEVPGHWIAAVGLDGDTILINDPFYRDRTTLDAYKGKVRSSVLYETSGDLSAVVLTAPADVKFKVTDRQGRVVSTGDTAGGGTGEPVNQIPGASFSAHRAWRDPTCIEKAPPTGAGTNQIMLPGSRDDYTIEILGTGDQAGSIAIHTYGRDGTGSIATIEGQEGTTAELGFDPNAPQPTVRVPNGNVTTTATPDSGGEGGGPGDETPTPAPTPSATPTPTGTPFVESRTNITLSAEPGQTRVETAGNTGFELGDPIRFAPGLPNEEDNLIVGFGSFLLATPLKFAHGPGEPILRLPRPPGQDRGCPRASRRLPRRGPLLPPDTVGLACSTIYQPSPKQATFICDLQVTGDYTNTRWSLNGQTVTDFTGSSSFLMAFNDDTPATVSATVCNVTICRSVTRAERIVFPANLSGTTFTGPGGTGTGAPPVVTPPAGGAVAIVCATEFPITPDGQLAQFTCQASFSGDFTSISWSAPGGTPANQSGKSKTFTTTVRNVEGAPVSLKVTATVCNFGTCRTSEPTTVGIGRTITTLESSPDGQVNSGHRLTLMARVDGIGGVVPQGGTVQFFADGFAIGPSATLFTVGKVAVAQVAVETTGLSSGDPDGSGIDHVFIGKYSGGINAFGSDSLERIITVLPPIKDGCDSVDEDNDGIVDNTCRNVVSPSTGFATAGSFATPKNLGGGTVLHTLSLAGGRDGSTATTLILRPGDPFTVSGSAGRTDYCPGCIRQVYIGIGGNQTSGAPPIGPKCVVSGGSPSTRSPTCRSVRPSTRPTSPGCTTCARQPRSTTSVSGHRLVHPRTPLAAWSSRSR
ncbi:MAG: FHA domain-containing protein [Dehalococcoidia bacterium]|nr:FHA domain-containing protein [Dehalococcoidia bacterium]